MNPNDYLISSSLSLSAWLTATAPGTRFRPLRLAKSKFGLEQATGTGLCGSISITTRSRQHNWLQVPKDTS